MGFFYCLFLFMVKFVLRRKNMKTLGDLLKGRDRVWFELKREEFPLFIEFARRNKLKWINGKHTFSQSDFENHFMFAHIEVAKDRTCCFVPMFMWIEKKHNHLKLGFNQ